MPVTLWAATSRGLIRTVIAAQQVHMKLLRCCYSPKFTVLQGMEREHPPGMTKDASRLPCTIMSMHANMKDSTTSIVALNALC